MFVSKISNTQHVSYFVVTLLVCGCVFAQAPDTLWTNTYGGQQSFEVHQTFDGGFIVVGRTGGNRDVYLVKTASNGDPEWTKSYGGGNTDDGFSVRQTADSGYVIAGTTQSFGAGGADVWLLRTDKNGDTLWTKTYGGIDDDGASSVGITADGGFVIAGHSSSYTNQNYHDIYLIKTDAIGDTIWTRTYGGDSGDYGESVKQIHDGGYIIAGRTYSFSAGGPHAYIVRADSLGDTLWTRTFLDGQAYWVLQSSDSCFVVSGESSFGTPRAKMWLAKLDLNGDTLWTRTYGDTMGADGESVDETYDGGYVIAGSITIQPGHQPHIYLVRTDEYGDTLWTGTYGDADHDRGESVEETTDRGYIIGGTTHYGTESDVYLIKTEPSVIEVREAEVFSTKCNMFGPTIVSGPLLLPEGKNCRVFDITGRAVAPNKIQPGIYFVEVDGVITRKVVKVR